MNELTMKQKQFQNLSVLKSINKMNDNIQYLHITKYYIMRKLCLIILQNITNSTEALIKIYMWKLHNNKYYLYLNY